MSPNSLSDGSAANDAALALVSASQPSSVGGELTTVEVSQHLGRSLAWVKRHAHELGGRLVGGAYHFPSIEVERRRTTTERITLGGGPKAESARDVGALAAKVFALLRSKAAPDEIVERLEADPATVRALCEEWAKCRSLATRLFAEPPPATPATSAWDHAPNPTWTCCPQHQALHQEIETEKR
jgi:hypothetical protein